MKKFILQKEQILIKLINQNSAKSAINGFLKIKTLILKNLYVMVVMIFQCAIIQEILQYLKQKMLITDVFHGI